MLLGVLVLTVIVLSSGHESPLREGQALMPIVLVAVVVMVGGFVLSLLGLNSPLTWIARSGTLLMGPDGMRLRVGGREREFTWSEPICVRRWRASFMGEDADVYEDMYEVWRLSQGAVHMTISRRTKVRRRRLLSQFAANGEGLPTTERGLLIPLKAQQVFEIIVGLGDLDFTEVHARRSH
jgi:hypothetical protein